MSDIQKRVNDYYNTMYGYGELKPEGVVRQKLDEVNELVAELEQQLSESRELENKWLRIAQEFERKNEVLEEANTIATALLDEATDMSWGSNEWLDEAIEFMDGKDVKG